VICYAAYGSHGIWKDAGDHNYGPYVSGVIELRDVCSNGTAWDGWEQGKLRAFDWENMKGLGGSDWPVWMSTDFQTAGSDPSSAGSFRYGNTERNCNEVKWGGEGFRFCELEDGPTGPVSKGVWGPDLG